MRRIILLLFCMGVLACRFSASQEPTPAPDRPPEREAIYISAVGRSLLSVTIQEMTLLAQNENPDTQILIVLADGNGNPAYLVYPANQPGVPETTFDFSEYPLQINTQSEQVGLWVLAFRHHAYPITKIEEISSQLANGFDLLQAQAVVDESYLTSIVASGDKNLLKWFGEVEILGELWLPLRKNDNYRSGENRIQSPDKGFYILYEVATETKSPTPTHPTDIPTAQGIVATPQN